MNKLIVRNIAKSINLLTKFLFLIPNIDKRNSLVKRLERWQKNINPDLFDDESFLYYVKRKKEGFEINCDLIHTLVMRGSNSDYGFYSPIWKNSYNLGLTSTDIYTSYYLYKNYREKLQNLKNLILFASVSFPGYSLIHTKERYRAVAYKYFFDIPYSDDEFINLKHEERIFKKCNNLKSVDIGGDYRGYERKTYYGTHLITQERVKKHLRENQREPNQLHWLKDLTEMAIMDNRKLFIVIQPFRSDYRKLLPDQSVLFEKLFLIKGIEFINFYDSKMFTDEDFGDTDHLNEQGASKLTNEIYQLFHKNNLL